MQQDFATILVQLLNANSIEFRHQKVNQMNLFVEFSDQVSNYEL